MNRIKKRVSWISAALAAMGLAIQFIPPTRTHSSAARSRDLTASDVAPAAKVTVLLRAACYDCHSYETEWPWYGHVAPVSWWLADHVKDARERLNFSDWPMDNPARAKKKLERISEEVESGDMPLKSYTWMHPAARLAPEDRKLIQQWAEQAAAQLRATAAGARPEK